ncbi:MAG: NAD(+)/NADH kinase [Akkermansiaceae bacterium]|nr:NAD(+)/NADH kinase [Akkermansiaceae bacterium]
MNIGIVAHPRKPEALGALRAVRKALEGRGFQLQLEVETAKLLGEKGLERFWEGVDLVISLGGDGTLLNTLHTMGGCPAPVAGINIGTLGFLTACQDEEIDEFAAVLEAGTQEIVERSMLKVRMEEEGKGVREFLAMNEVVLMRGETGRLVSLEARIDGDLLNHYRADGLIVATPTGSTAYSLAAGGPLISPRAGVFVLSPICPHSLSNRSLIVGDDSVVEIQSAGENNEPILFTVDGRKVLRLAQGCVVRVEKATDPLLLVRMPGHSFYDTLRRKLRWHGRV